MTTVTSAIEHLSLDITEEIRVRASLAATFDALLEEMGPSNQGQRGVSMPMTLEPWPGGRWFRDLGNGNGHLWGHVQAIKRPTLLEIAGPLMMSFAVASNVQYRLKEVDEGTLDHAAAHGARAVPARRLPRGARPGMDDDLRSSPSSTRNGVTCATHDGDRTNGTDRQPAAGARLGGPDDPSRSGAVPEDRLAWRPHRKARTLGELAIHVATVPGLVAQLGASRSPGPGARLRGSSRTRNARSSSSRLSTRASPARRRCSARWTMRQ